MSAQEAIKSDKQESKVQSKLQSIDSQTGVEPKTIDSSKRDAHSKTVSNSFGRQQTMPGVAENIKEFGSYGLDTKFEPVNVQKNLSRVILKGKNQIVSQNKNEEVKRNAKLIQGLENTINSSQFYSDDEKMLLLKKIGRFKFLETVRNREWEMLADELKIDPTIDPPIFSNFLNLVTTANLPLGWKRELNPSGDQYYFEIKTEKMHYVHPEIHRIKQLHNDFLFHIQTQNESAIMPRYKLEKRFGPILKNPNMIYSSFFEGDIEKQMHELIENIEKNTIRKNEMEKQEEINSFLIQAKQFYVEEFGLDHNALREVFEKLKSYQYLNLKTLRENLEMFNICEGESYLVWIVRLYEFLPLHKDWIAYFDNNLDQICYRHKTILHGTHLRPCYYYTQYLQNRMSKDLYDNGTKREYEEELHIFLDHLGREIKLNNAKIFDFKNFYPVYEQDLKLNEKDEKKTKVQANRHPFLLKYEAYYMNPNNKDSHLYDVCDQLEIDINDTSQVHLLVFINEYITTEPKTKKWQYRLAQDEKSEAFWINHDLKKISLVYPFLDELRKKLDIHKKEIVEKYEKMQKFKDLAPLETIMGTSDRSELKEYLNTFRKPLLNEYASKKYFFDVEKYSHHKVNENFLHTSTSKDINIARAFAMKGNRMSKAFNQKNVMSVEPTLDSMIEKPYDLKDFSGIQPRPTHKEVMDLLFFNFFKFDVKEGKMKLDFFKNVETETQRNCQEKLIEFAAAGDLDSGERKAFLKSIVKFQKAADSTEQIYTKEIKHKIKDIEYLMGILLKMEDGDINTVAFEKKRFMYLSNFIKNKDYGEELDVNNDKFKDASFFSDTVMEPDALKQMNTIKSEEDSINTEDYTVSEIDSDAISSASLSDEELKDEMADLAEPGKKIDKKEKKKLKKQLLMKKKKQETKKLAKISYDPSKLGGNRKALFDKNKIY